jgi:benzylsuccinate CoA-transferase BbsF subunit
VRAANPHAVEAAIGRMTASRDPFELMAALRASGVPAGVALRGSDLLVDDTLRQRGHFWSLPHPEMGVLDYNGPAYQFEATPSRLTKSAPCLGEDTAFVLKQVLSFHDEKIAELTESGVLT